MTLDELRLQWEIIAIRNMRYTVQVYLQRKADRAFFGGTEWLEAR